MRLILVNTLLASSTGPFVSAEVNPCVTADYQVLATLDLYSAGVCMTQSEFSADMLRSCLSVSANSKLSDSCAAALFSDLSGTLNAHCIDSCPGSDIVSDACNACSAAALSHAVATLAPAGTGACAGAGLSGFVDVSFDSVIACGTHQDDSNKAFCVTLYAGLAGSCLSCMGDQMGVKVAQCNVSQCSPTGPISQGCNLCNALTVVSAISICNAGTTTTTTTSVPTTTVLSTTIGTTRVTTNAAAPFTFAGHITFLITSLVILG